MKKKHRVGIMAKLISMSTLPVIFLGVILTVYGQYALRTNLKAEIYDGLKSAAISVKGAYDAAGEGDFVKLQSGNIINGTFIVNNNYNLVDSLSESAGTETAFFYGEEAVVTSFMDEEKNRILDMKADQEVNDQVLGQGKEYFSENVTINGETYYGYYMPVSNENGSVVGMIFSGKRSTEVDEMIRNASFQMVGLGFFIGLLTVIVMAYLSANMTKVLKKTMVQFDSVAQGDLSEQKKQEKMRRNDEISDMADSVVMLRESLRSIISKIRLSSGKLMTSAEGLEQTAVATGQTSEGVSRTVEEISLASSSQAEETEAAMTHVTDMGNLIEQIVGDVGILNDKATNMETAGQTVENVIEEINGFTARTTEVVERISVQTETTNESAQEIRKAVEMIRSITEETNLLSLNASIEAARAGEHGRGFAVVAMQIQKLAEQSNGSAQQIEQIIKILLEDSDKTVETMKEMVDIVAEQREKLQKASESFAVVNAEIKQSLQKIDGIYQKSEILDDSRKQVLDLFTNLAAESEENAASVEETTAAIQQLNETVNDVTQEAAALKDLAVDLEEQIQIFKL